MDFRHIANFLNSPDSVEDLSVSSPPPSDDDIIHIKVNCYTSTVRFVEDSPGGEGVAVVSHS